MNLIDYHALLRDEARLRSFRRAIERTAAPGRRVLDLGTGLGTYAIYAARAGARVYAVEADPIIEVARALARENGVADRIRFLRGRAEEIVPPEPVDLLIFEDYAPFLCQAETADLLREVRERWLEPDAKALPRALEVRAAPVSCPDTYERLSPRAAAAGSGLALGSVATALRNDLHRAVWGSEVLLDRPQMIARVDPLEPGTYLFSRHVRWSVERDAECHGLGLWLDLELADGVRFSNAPGDGRSRGWDQVLLPLENPVGLRAGDRIEAEISTLRDPDGLGPIWWRWRVETGAGVREMHTFRSAPLSLERLLQARPDFRPSLTRGGRRRHRVLDAASRNGQSVEELAAELQERYPDLFRGRQDAYRAIREAVDAGSIGSLERAAEKPSHPTGGRG